MKSRFTAAVALVSIAAAAIAFSGNTQPPSSPAAPPEQVDRAKITVGASDFAQAFQRGDASAIAAMYTENGECRDANGQTFVGRTAIKKAYADFFKANPGVKVGLRVKAVRFPAPNLAVEEGILTQSRGPKSLPSSTAYVTVHVREGDGWKIALSSEGGADLDRLEDLEWLLGEWAVQVKGEDMTLSFTRDINRPVINALFKRKVPNKQNETTTVRIAVDPETGGLRSWHFEDDGAHSQSVWHNDDKSWLLECRGVLANGVPTSETIVLQRVGADAITWRAIDRMLGDEELPDTKPVRLTRVKR